MFIASRESRRYGRFSSILFAAFLEAINIALVLGTLATILFIIHQSWKIFKSAFRQFVTFEIGGSEENKVAPSANRSSMQVFIDIGKLLMHIEKAKAQELILED